MAVRKRTNVCVTVQCIAILSMGYIVISIYH